MSKIELEEQILLEYLPEIEDVNQGESVMVKSALIEAKKLLEFYIESTDDLDAEQTESVKYYIKALRAGCDCDDYNGFDCGCGKRAFLCDGALKELEGSTCH